MAANGEQDRRNIQAGNRYLEAIDRIFPGKIEPDLIQALKGAEDHPLLLDLIVKSLATTK